MIDEGTGMVSRFMMRARAVELEDDGIAELLKGLEPTDYLMARAFEIPNQFKASSLHDNVESMVPIVGFHENLQQILEQACRALKEDYAKLQGINLSSG